MWAINLLFWYVQPIIYTSEFYWNPQNGLFHTSTQSLWHTMQFYYPAVQRYRKGIELQGWVKCDQLGFKCSDWYERSLIKGLWHWGSILQLLRIWPHHCPGPSPLRRGSDWFTVCRHSSPAPAARHAQWWDCACGCPKTAGHGCPLELW